MAEYQSKFTGQEVDNALDKLRSWIAADATTKPTDGSNTNISTVTISGNTYAVLWKVAPTSSNQVYGIGLHTTSGRIYQIYNNKGTYSAISLDSNSDTKDTAGSTNLTDKLYLIGAQSQATYAVTYSNSAVYTQSGNLYATTMYANSKEVATKEWVEGKNYLTGISSTTTSATGYIPYISAVSYTAGTAVTSGETKYAHPSFTGTQFTTGANSSGITVASSTHTHVITLTSSSNTTGVKYVKSVDVQGTTKYAGATFSGNSVASGAPNTGGTVDVASTGHTHSTSVSLKANADTTTNAVTYIESVATSAVAQKHLTAGFSGSKVTSTAPSATTTVSSTSHTHTASISLKANTGTTTNAITYVESVGASDATQKHLTASFSGTAATSGAPSGTTTVASTSHTHTNSITLTPSAGATTNAITYVESVGASDAARKRLTASFSGTAATSNGPSGTTTAASNAHTHNVTAKGSVSLTANTDTTTGRITYVESIANTPVSVSTTTVASNAHTHTVTAAGTISLGPNTTASGGTAYVAAVTLPTSKTTGDAAPQGHTHTYDKTTGVTISGGESGDITVATNITGSAASGSPTTKYLHWSAGTTPYSTATLNTTTVATAVDSGDGATVASSNHTHTYNTYSLTGSNASGTKSYLRFSAGTTPKSGATPGHTSTNTGNDSGSGTSVASATHTHVINLTANTANTTNRITYVESISSTKASASGTAKAGSETHTHNYDKTTGVTLTANAATANGRIKYVEDVTHVHTPASLGAAGTSSAAPGGHTHTVTVSGTTGDNTSGVVVPTATHAHGITLSALTGTTTGAVAYISGFSAGTTPPKSASFTGTKTNSLVTGVTWHSTSTKVLYGSRTTSGSGTTARRTLEIKAYDLSVSKGDYTPAGSVSLTDGTAPSATTSYLRAVISANSSTTVAAAKTHSHSYGSSTALTTGANSGTNFNAVTGYPNFDGGSGSATPTYKYLSAAPSHTATASGSPSATTSFVTGVTGGTTTAVTKYLSGEAGTVSATTTVASHTHTHSYDKTTSVSLTNGTAPSLSAVSTSTTGDIGFISGMTNGSIGLTTNASAGTTGSPSATATVAAHTHTHDYVKGTSVSLSGGTKPSLTSNSTSTDGIKYLEAYSVSGGNWSATQTKLSAAPSHTSTNTGTNSGTKVAAITALNAGSVTTQYFHPSFSGTAVSTGTITGTVSVVSNATGGSTSATTKYLSAAFTGSSAATGSPVGTAVTAASADHTHSTTATGNVSLADTATSGGILFVQATKTVNPTTKYLLATGSVGTATGSTEVATKDHTHNTTATGSVNLADTATSGGIAFVQATKTVNPTTRYLTVSGSVGTASGETTVATGTHTHDTTTAGTVSLSDTATSGGVLFAPTAQTVTATPKYLTASGSIGTATGSTTVATSTHTHNTTATGSVSLTLADSTASGKVGVITSLSGGAGTYEYLSASSGTLTGTVDVAAKSHTHTGTATGNVSLGLNDTASGGSALIVSLTTGSVGGSITTTTKYLKPEK